MKSPDTICPNPNFSGLAIHYYRTLNSTEVPLNPSSIVLERTPGLIGLLSGEPFSHDAPHWTNIPYLSPLCSLKNNYLFSTFASFENLIRSRRARVSILNIIYKCLTK